jgi:acetate kinase
MTESAPVIGVINAGSSSFKFALYEEERRTLSGQVEGIGVRPAMSAKSEHGEPLIGLDMAQVAPETPGDALMALLPWLREQLGGRAIMAIGHRVVHGGPNHVRPLPVTPALLEELAALSSLAPLHQPHNLAPIRVALERQPRLPQVACFDTAFHHTMPPVTQAFALPEAFMARGIRRYGFHGLSYEYIASRLPHDAPGIAEGRVVVAHLGNGASLCALRAGQSVATTMGFSALDGLPMGTRCGELDPGVVLHLIRSEGMSPEKVEDMLYKRSGMLGLSGVSSDFRDLLASPDPRARFALDVFVHRVARHVGSLAAALGGIDGLVFTAGVGENAAPIRAAICEACAWLGLQLDPEANKAHQGCISRPGSSVAAHIIPTDENLMIARHTQALVMAGGVHACPS